MKLLFSATFLLCGTVSVAHADNCANAITERAMNTCAGQAYKKTDAELNRVYQQIRSRLKNNHRSTQPLVNAEKNWLAFRDAECAFTASASIGGSVHPMIVTQCRDNLTHCRVEQLKGYLHCQERDLSCPVPNR